jgi:hypothetical protein
MRPCYKGLGNPMANIIVEPDKKKGGYAALKDGKVVVRGETQKEAADKAHKNRPQDTILAAHVRNTATSGRDKLRKVHGPSK